MPFGKNKNNNTPPHISLDWTDKRKMEEREEENVILRNDSLLYVKQTIVWENWLAYKCFTVTVTG